jgi:hypothetical protein
MSKDLWVGEVPCASTERMVQLYISETGDLLFFVRPLGKNKLEPFDIEAEESAEALGLTSPCMILSRDYEEDPIRALILYFGAKLVNKPRIVQYSIKWMESAPVFDEIDDEWRDEQERARAFLRNSIHMFGECATGPSHYSWESTPRDDAHEFLYRLREWADSHGKGYPLPTWIEASIRSNEYFHAMLWSGAYEFTQRNLRGLASATTQFQDALTWADEDRWGNEAAALMAGNRLYVLAKTLRGKFHD